MKSIHQWFDEYGQSHQNQTNKVIHWICVPMIFFSLLGLLSLIPLPWLSSHFPPPWQPYVHGATLLVIAGLLFYLRLSPSLALGMAVFSAICLQLIHLMQLRGISVGLVSLSIFALAWVGQFIGHKIEKAKPSFLKDLQFLMIGPAWLLGFIYRRLNIKY